MQNLQTSQAFIFHVLQHFATKLGNFTNFNMLFLAVVKDFDFFAKMKIQFKRGMVHCTIFETLFPAVMMNFVPPVQIKIKLKVI